ncbi:MAG: FecR domain-containing protein [Devosia sp.]|uniref:FecR family protein n=1 Tax=Devosia sp. TaxID=1871048 RepID=UPI0024CB4DE2|nr:FecR domain-containing protein [Devosia sp.]UYO00140.1 MAG: FecR domain-containing protein [Devosia sp.]
MKSLVSAAITAILLCAPAVAANEGKAVDVVPQAVNTSGGAERTLVVGADVSVGDRVTTGPEGRVQLLFDDQTKLVVGPGSALTIEAYLLKGNTVDKFTVNALAGTFRFISGNSPKSAYSIKTPTASIAVRGTRFDLAVTRNFTQAMLYEGALSLCQGSTCIELAKRCDIGALGASQPGLLGWDSDQRSGMVRNFPFARLQSILQPAFRVSGAHACTEPPPVQSLDSLVEAPQNETPYTYEYQYDYTNDD